MGGKRGRTQRRHFKQNRESVWRHDNSKRTCPDASSNAGGESSAHAAGDSNPSWEPFTHANPGFEEYYKEQGIVPEDEWEEFISFLRKPLPAAFRINSSGQFCQDIRSQLETDILRSLQAVVDNQHEVDAIRPLPWYPENLAWQLNFSRMQLRKNHTLERFHEFLKLENEVGTITRQEAVSMVPPLFLDVSPAHHILDMCAAPGSKTFQLLEIIHQSLRPGLLPTGLVIANDVDIQRCNLLIHQTKRMCSANLIVTNHEAQHFPTCTFLRDRLETSSTKPEFSRKSTLQFDRVLCDVPCSGDGTLRKAPDMWRKWNAGMGNGLHRLQVEIAMRGLAMLKVGGRLVYSTCSMNPVENEAVVAEILRRSSGSVILLDVSDELPELVRRPGLKTWKVRDKGIWLAAFGDVPNCRRSVILPSMFPSNKSSKEHQMKCHVHESSATVANETVVEQPLCSTTSLDNSYIEHERFCENKSCEVILPDVSNGSGESNDITVGNLIEDNVEFERKAEISTFPLQHCMRILPYDQNTGAFFIAVFQKLSLLQEILTNQECSRHTEKNIDKNFVDEEKGKEMPLEVPQCDNSFLNQVTTDVNIVDDDSTGKSVKIRDTNYTAVICHKENESGEPSDRQKDELLERDTEKGKLQYQGKWKGMDPVIFFKDEAVMDSIRSFYGISESFRLDGHLVTRNSDTNHVKRIYYISESVHDILQLNNQVGQRLKIASLGLKVFERQASKNGSSCAFRLSSEGLPVLLPFINRQVLLASLIDFRNLLRYRAIKFADFVDSGFGNKASELMTGCCVVVLDAAPAATDSRLFDSSTISIVCWKGKTNISIMVSQLDGQELLERLSVRFGSAKDSADTAFDPDQHPCNDDIDNENLTSEDGSKNHDDFEQADMIGEEES